MREFLGKKCFRTLLLVSLYFPIFFLNIQAEKLPFKIYNVADGLAHNSILSIYQDRKGFLWFGTFEGLSLFDGYSFANYGESDGLPNSFVNYITEDRRGHLWVATNGGGIARLIDNPKEHGGAKFVSFKIRETSKTPNNSANKVNRILFDAGGNLWCLTDWGLYRAVASDEHLKFKTVVEKNTSDSNAAFEDADGGLWFGVADELIEIRNAKLINHGSIANTSANNLITGIIRDHEGRLLISDYYNLFEFITKFKDKKHSEWRKKKLPLRRTNSRIKTLFTDETGEIWLGTTSGLVRSAKGEQSEYNSENGLNADNVRVITKDRDDNLWIGTEGGGVCQLINQAIVSYTRSEGLSNAASEVFEDDQGKIWVTQADKIAEIQNGKVVLHKQPEKFLSVEKGIILSRYNGIWIQNTKNFILKVAKPLLNLRSGNDIDISNFFPKGSEDYYLSVYEDEHGILWLAKPDGKIYRADTNAKDKPLSGSFQTNTNFSVIPLITGDGKDGLWLGAVEKLGRLHNGKYSAVKASEGLPEANPRSFFTDSRGWLWIGLRFKGVSVTKEPFAENPSFTNYSFEQNQLSSNAVRSITEDDTGRIYFATDRGLDRFDPNKNHWTHFTTKDGLAGNMIYSVLKDKRGFIWIGTEGGLSRFDPRQEKIPKSTLPIYISRVQIAGENLTLPETGTDSIKPLDLSSASNNLTVEFVAPNFQNQDNVFYQYNLSGIDSDWSKPTKERVVTFARLAAGEYRFSVRAIDNHGITSVKPAVFEFRILPPIWQRWWFIALVILFAVLLIYLVYRNRLKRLLELERVRTRIATDLHDDIGANLTRISLMSEVAKQNTENGSDNLLSSIADIARESVASMNDIVWAISPEHDSLLDLTRRMRQHAEEVFSYSEIDLVFNSAAADLKLSVGRRRDILLIFKEAVNNALKHSECSKVEIDFRSNNSRLFLQISDNGKGFESNMQNSGNGLRSLNRRAAVLGGKIEITSRENVGTNVKFELPLSNTTRI